jgi:glycosyltransferase involved in cell wall biosynthesis
MKILIVSQYFWPEDFRINELASELCLRGHDIRILTGQPNYPEGKLYPDYRRDPAAFASYGGMKIQRVPIITRGKRTLKLMANYASFVISGSILGPLRLHGWRPDLVFVCQLSPVTIGIPGVVIGRLARVPVVLWSLDLWPESLTAVGAVRSKRVLRMVEGVVRWIYRRCTLLLGQSDSFLASLARNGGDPGKVRYFPNWAEGVFADMAVEPAPEIPHEPGAFTILFAGNVGDAQDMPAVIDAADRLRKQPGLRWVIVGDGRKLDWVRSEVSRRRLEDRVLLVGRFPAARMPSFFAHADALLVSLRSDPIFRITIPGKVQSYLMAGIPLLGMLDGEGAAVIEAAAAGLTCPAGDSEALAAQAVALASRSREERQELGNNGRRYAVAHYSKQGVMDCLEHVLGEAVTLYSMQRKAR